MKINKFIARLQTIAKEHPDMDVGFQDENSLFYFKSNKLFVLAHYNQNNGELSVFESKPNVLILNS